MPQCAVIGWPGQRGQTSWAALSQTVKTKSVRGAVGRENSTQDLLRRPSTAMPAERSCRMAPGRTEPEGWLPALNAVKLPSDLWFRMASAMMDRAELPVQRKRTL